MYDKSQQSDDTPAALIDDVTAIESTVVSFLRERVESAGADGVVVAMGGGLDSTVTAALAVEALGPDRVLGLGLPCHKTDAAATMEAAVVADHLGIEFRRVQLQPLLREFTGNIVPALEADGEPGPTPTQDRAIAETVARLRMACAYYAANQRNRLVVGTANRSELLLGYVTKYGDGAADLFPLGELYKTEVRVLGEYLGLPEPIVEQVPTTGLYPGQTDADDLGATYDAIDSLLYRVVEEGESVTEAADAINLDEATARRLVSMCSETADQRTMPPVADVYDRCRQPTTLDAE